MQKTPAGLSGNFSGKVMSKIFVKGRGLFCLKKKECYGIYFLNLSKNKVLRGQAMAPNTAPMYNNTLFITFIPGKK